VNGFALALPNAIAGLLSIFLVFKLVRRPFGTGIGLIASLALAITPVVVATERNNTVDGMLVFVLLAAAWAFLQSVYTGRVRWLFLGAALVGLGFNIKMLQAYMALPAFYALYLIGAKHKGTTRLLHLAAATLLLLVVSFSWAIAVDLTPSADRPYVDSTSGNSVMQLIFGHNGIERLANTGMGGPLAPNPNLPQGNPPQLPSGSTFTRPAAGFGQPFGVPGNGPGFAPPALDDGRMYGPPSDGGQFGGGPGGSMDFGTAGTLRLLTEPLAGEASWLLPFALGGLIVLALVLWRRPFGDQHLSVILWAGWLLPEFVYFTYSRGLMHAYYLIMLGAPIAALVAIAAWGLWQIIKKNRLAGWALAMLLAGGTLAFESYTLLGNTSLDILALEAAGILFGLGVLLALGGTRRSTLGSVALSLVLLAVLVPPAVRSGLTTFNRSSPALPTAGPAGPQAAGSRALRAADDDGRQIILPMSPSAGSVMQPTAAGGVGPALDHDLLDFLLANTKPGTHLLAVGRANAAAPYILATGRPVLTLGGFLHQYDEVSALQVSAMVGSGQLRYVLYDSLDRHQAVAQWVQQYCSPVDRSSFGTAAALTSTNRGDANSGATLYDCGG
jgi:4-amino-4-deoxy-L-arabinose transferase-like glycosyltransferase